MYPLGSKDTKFSNENNKKITALTNSSHPPTNPDPVHREAAATPITETKVHS